MAFRFVKKRGKQPQSRNCRQIVISLHMGNEATVPLNLGKSGQLMAISGTK